MRVTIWEHYCFQIVRYSAVVSHFPFILLLPQFNLKIRSLYESSLLWIQEEGLENAAKVLWVYILWFISPLIYLPFLQEGLFLLVCNQNWKQTALHSVLLAQGFEWGKPLCPKVCLQAKTLRPSSWMCTGAVGLLHLAGDQPGPYPGLTAPWGESASETVCIIVVFMQKPNTFSC